MAHNKTFEEHLKDLKNCTACQGRLPFAPHPVVQISPEAKLLIISQAPGLKAHETSQPFNDPSGDRLRSWLQLSREQFYDEHNVALMPMGFCYPGRDPKGGDLPPLRICAPLWHNLTLKYLKNVQLTLLIGQYAQKYYLKKRCKTSLTETVKSWREYLPQYFPLPHPSWRNNHWLKKNPWFEDDLLPELRRRVASALAL